MIRDLTTIISKPVKHIGKAIQMHILKVYLDSQHFIINTTNFNDIFAGRETEIPFLTGIHANQPAPFDKITFYVEEEDKYLIFEKLDKMIRIYLIGQKEIAPWYILINLDKSLSMAEWEKISANNRLSINSRMESQSNFITALHQKDLPTGTIFTVECSENRITSELQICQYVMNQISRFLVLLNTRVISKRSKSSIEHFKKEEHFGKIHKRFDINAFFGESSNSESKDRWHNRIHIARGHFKRYTPDSPLLGKHIGTYWWTPTVRGLNKKGEVVKTYNIVS